MSQYVSPFIRMLAPRFSFENWTSGLSLYRSEAVTFLKTADDVVYGRVREAIGNSYEVRLRLQKSGRLIQWMECDCPANRRKSEWCCHLAAFCISLDQEQIAILQRYDSNFFQTDLNDVLFIHEERALALQKPSVSRSAFQADAVFSQEGMQILKVDLAKEHPWVKVEVILPGNKQVVYQFHLDDAFRLFARADLHSLFSSELRKKKNNNEFARRAFFISQGKDAQLIIDKVVQVGDQMVEVTKIPLPCLGTLGIFLEKEGYLNFRDDLEPIKAQEWFSYVPQVILNIERSAHLVETGFQFFKDIAPVFLSKEVESLVIETTLLDSQVIFEEDKDGTYSLSSESGLLDIVRARQEGRHFLKTQKGYLKLSKEFDWLKSKVSKSGKVVLTRAELIKFHEMFKESFQIEDKTHSFKKLSIGLGTKKDIQIVETPHYESLKLRPYQDEGVRWLWWLYQNSLGGILADEMGLGKTHQAIGLMDLISSSEPHCHILVICPTSVLDHWAEKVKEYLSIPCFLYYGQKRAAHLQDLKDQFVVITTYGILLRDMEIFRAIRWNLLILDEAQLVKNQTTRTYKAAFRVPSRMKLCLTGTPLENNLLELKNLFDVVLPGYLGSQSEFRNHYLKNPDPLRELEFRKLIYPFQLRRKKEDVMRDLPVKVEDIRFCRLNELQKKLYKEAIQLRGQPLIDELARDANPIPYIHIFSLISLLKQICDDPGLIDAKYDHMGSGKLELFDELLEECLASGHKVVVFSQYAKMIDRLAKRLKLKEIGYVTLTGQSLERGKIIKSFQNDPAIQVFLGSLLAGGTGINLTGASVVIHFDRWWNSAKEDQATDRVHRIGQKKNVQVYKFVTKGTLEERIHFIIQSKRQIFDKFIETGAEAIQGLTREEILSLLNPSLDEAEED